MISIIDIIGFSITMLAVALVIISVYLVIEVNDLKGKIDSFYSSYNDMFSKVNSLYKGDEYGTLRPKVDILQDWFEDSRSNSYDIVEKLEDRLDELEEENKK